MAQGISLDLGRIGDRDLRAVGEKVVSGTRLSHSDAELLFTSPDLLGIGMLADYVNRRKHGDVVTFAANQHINPTNVCYLRKTCVFCSFARLPKEEGAYHYTLDEVFAEAEAAAAGLTKEFHIVGVLDMKAGLGSQRHVSRAQVGHPHVHIKARPPRDRALARRTRCRSKIAGRAPRSWADTFRRAPRCLQSVRMTIADKKLAAEDWIDVHRTAHRLGIRSNCTMLYGHVETIQDRVEHLSMLRDLQDESGGFLAYIPLAYHPDHNELGIELGRQGTATTGFDDLRNLAAGRLFLDNFDHIKTHWIMVTPFLSQTSLAFGVNDLEGTVVREKIYHEAGAHTAQGLSLDEILDLIRSAGKTPAERDSFYNILRVFDRTPGAVAA